MMVMLMNELKESELIVAEIKKTERLYDDMKKYIIIKINYDKDADEKAFEFQGFFNDGIESIESTAKLTTLNAVMKELLNENYVLDFNYESY